MNPSAINPLQWVGESLLDLRRHFNDWLRLMLLPAIGAFLATLLLFRGLGDLDLSNPTSIEQIDPLTSGVGVMLLLFFDGWFAANWIRAMGLGMPQVPGLGFPPSASAMAYIGRLIAITIGMVVVAMAIGLILATVGLAQLAPLLVIAVILPLTVRAILILPAAALQTPFTIANAFAVSKGLTLKLLLAFGLLYMGALLLLMTIASLLRIALAGAPFGLILLQTLLSFLFQAALASLQFRAFRDLTGWRP